ncbi:hypothetical protein AAG570_008149 [Ranatra chinensis]|uniref:Uncharacterized protein n=1 Tax=Ranatra chinensis TaxID=642074 RepID=A0ABD0XTY8_9HEMI
MSKGFSPVLLLLREATSGWHCLMESKEKIAITNEEITRPTSFKSAWRVYGVGLRKIGRILGDWGELQALSDRFWQIAVDSIVTFEKPNVYAVLKWVRSFIKINYIMATRKLKDVTEGRKGKEKNTPIHQIGPIRGPQAIGHVLREKFRGKTPFEKENKLEEKRQKFIDAEKKEKQLESIIRHKQNTELKWSNAHVKSCVDKIYDETKEAELKEKRSKLKELFHDENEDHIEEFIDLPQLSYDRKAKEYLAKHKQLMKNKEEADKQLCKKKFDQLFRQNSVELREYISQQRKKETAEMQKIQIQEKEIKKKLEKGQNKGVQSLIEGAEMSLQDIIEGKRHEKKKETATKHFEELKKQLNDNQMLLAEQKRYKAKERDEFRELQELRKREDEQWLEIIRQAKIKLRNTMYSQMEKNIERKKEQAEAQKKLDIEYVQAATNESICERKANAILKAKIKEDIETNFAYHNIQKKCQKQREDLMKKIEMKTQAEYEELSEQRRQKELEHRNKLIKEVNEFQKQQITEKQDAKVREKIKLQIEGKQGTSQNKIHSLELDKRIHSKNEKLGNQNTLKAQIDAKNHLKGPDGVVVSVRDYYAEGPGFDSLRDMSEHCRERVVLRKGQKKNGKPREVEAFSVSSLQRNVIIKPFPPRAPIFVTDKPVSNFRQYVLSDHLSIKMDYDDNDITWKVATKKALRTKNRAVISRTLDALQLLVLVDPMAGPSFVPYFKSILPLDIQSQKGGKLHVLISVVSCFLFLWNKKQETTDIGLHIEKASTLENQGTGGRRTGTFPGTLLAFSLPTSPRRRARSQFTAAAEAVRTCC